MDEEQLKIIASQLRKPHGENAEFFGNKMNEGNKELYENTLSVLELNNNDKVLEVGMGNGYYVKDVLKIAKNIKYHGCDYSKEMVHQSNKLNDELVDPGNVQFHLSSASNLPFHDNYFDSIFSINTVYFWDDKSIILDELSRVLKPDGKLIIALRPEKSMQAYPFGKFGFELFSKEIIKKLLLENNFEVISIVEKEEATQMIDDLEVKVESLIIIAEKIIRR